MSTNVPVIEWVNGSPVIPAELDILAGVQADINAAFGGGVNPSLQTPQGQLAQSETAIIGDKNNQIAYIANQINPSMSSGIWQDAIGYIYFLQRIQSAGTVVNADCVGAVGVVIPAGSIAQDTTGYKYASTSTAVIPPSGTISVQFQNQTVGAIACAIGALSTIYTAVAGWNTINNTAAGSLGNLVESRAEFELRRQNSVAGNAVNTVQSLYGAVLSVPNVLEAFVVDNPTNGTVNYGSTNYPLVAHSVVVSVAGGAESAIAQAIWDKKPPGTNYNGNTSATVYDTNYPSPYPSYTVTWLTPDSTAAYFAVEIADNSQLPANIVTLVQNAILSSFYGQDGGIPAGINQTTFSGRYYANVTAINQNVDVLSILLGFSAIGATLTSLTFGIDELPTLSASQIVVTLV